MRIPFSYKGDFFKTVLIGSSLAHVFFFVPLGFFSPSPRYGVEQAPSNMEVVIVREERKPEKVEKTEDILALKDNSPAPEVAKKEEIKKEWEEEPLKSVDVAPLQGAITEEKPAYLKNPAPHYPRLARKNGWQGIVLLHVRVQKNGIASPVLVKESSGYKTLDDEAVATVKKWKFSPGKIGKLELETWIQIPVRFVLEQKK